MNGRQRLTNILNLQPTDRISWTTLADSITLSAMPEYIRSMPMVDFYRFIGCDIFQLGNYGNTITVSYPYKLIRPEFEICKYTDPDGYQVNKVITDWGELISKAKDDHFVKYPVQTFEDMKILKNIWLNSYYEIRDGCEENPWLNPYSDKPVGMCEESYRKVLGEIGNDGVYIPRVGPSPVQRLLQFDMGTENFYYLLEDYEKEMEELLDIMHNCRLQEYRIIAEKMPFDTCVGMENTSTTLISPKLYRRLSLPQIRDFVDIMHSNGKKAILHMCGYLKNLLNDLKDTGLDGIHALTPPPVGDSEYELALDVLGEELIIIGCMDSTVFHRKDVARQEIWELLDRTITPRIKKSNFILWAVADGLPTPVEKFHMIKEWIDRYGNKGIC